MSKHTLTIDDSSSDNLSTSSDDSLADISKFIIPTQTCEIITPTHTPNPTPNIETPLPTTNPDDFNLHDVAVSLKTKTEKSGLTKEDALLVNSSIRLNKKYNNSLLSVEKRFFATIEEYGTNKIKLLLAHHDDGLNMTRLFYIKLRGEKRLQNTPS